MSDDDHREPPPLPAAGLGAGMPVIAGILVGALLGGALGYVADRLLIGAMIGGAVGLVAGFYLLYITYFKPR
jgi:hypothetical protein